MSKSLQKTHDTKNGRSSIIPRLSTSALQVDRSRFVWTSRRKDQQKGVVESVGGRFHLHVDEISPRGNCHETGRRIPHPRHLPILSPKPQRPPFHLRSRNEYDCGG